MADPQSSDPLDPSFYEGVNFLGRPTSVSLFGQEPGQPATALAAGGAPVSAASSSTPVAGSSNQASTVAGTSPQSDVLSQLLQGGVGNAKKISDLFSTSPDPERGDTGNVSLSDQVRSGGSGVASSVAPNVPPTFTPGSFDLGSIPGAISPTDPSTVAPVSGFAENAAATAPELIANEAPQIAEDIAQTSATSALEGGGVMSAIAAIPDFWEMMNTIFSGHAKSQLKETEGIRKDFASAWPSYADAPNTLAKLATMDTTAPPEQQVKSLQGLLDTAIYQMDQAPAVSQFLSTEGGRQTFIPGTDVSGYNAVSGQDSRAAVLSGLLASDRLSKLGSWSAEQDAASPFSNPQGYLGILLAQAGVPNKMETNEQGQSVPVSDYTSYLTPQELAGLEVPGNRMATIQGILSRLNPDFATTEFGQQFSSVAGGSPSAPAADAGSPPPPTTPPNSGTPGAGLFDVAPPIIAGGTAQDLAKT